MLTFVYVVFSYVADDMLILLILLADVDDFPAMKNPSALYKVTPAPRWSGGGGSAARVQPASEFVVGPSPKDSVITSVFFGVLVPPVFFNI